MSICFTPLQTRLFIEQLKVESKALGCFVGIICAKKFSADVNIQDSKLRQNMDENANWDELVSQLDFVIRACQRLESLSEEDGYSSDYMLGDMQVKLKLPDIFARLFLHFSAKPIIKLSAGVEALNADHLIKNFAGISGLSFVPAEQ